jgi:hypothetical protein
MPQIGNFLYKDDNDKIYLTFESEGETPRVFTAVNYHAYNANGLIGSEKNGVAILDNGTEMFSDLFVVASDIEKGSLFGQTATMEILKKLNGNWDEFKKFITSRGEYRENVFDISEDFETPVEGNKINLHALGILDLKDEKDIRTKEMVEVNNRTDVPYDFPPIGRVGIITELMNHSVHRDGPYDDFYLSWNVKMDMDLDETGKKGDYNVDSQFDEKWSEYFERYNDHVFYDIIGEMTRFYCDEQLYSTFPGDDQGDYGFALQGRHGGHLVLKTVEGSEIKFNSYSNVQEVLNNLDDDDLVKLYKVVKSLDHDITKQKLANEWAYQLNFMRNRMEEDWKLELENVAKM